ncbi:PIG-M-domain-containing protein [Gorgonomyces haynaldii]|nr:PIG-M-domain-containing protein [Gorgonomyces haynaldii]
MIIAGLGLRLLLLVYSIIQDQHPVVKYTDIDYQVFTDAANQVLLGHSPYNRDTYRYTPLLAMIMVPNVWMSMWGKLIFCFSDLLVSYYLEKILVLMKLDKRWGLLWTLNPFVAVISTRGNAESIMALLVVLVLYLLMKRRVVWSGVVFGLAVHLKIYPIIYCVPIWFGMDHLMGKPYRFRWLSWNRLLFGLVSASTFFALGLIMHQLYGHEFFDQTYFYHLIRKDHRHNFSLYFYHIYLTYDDPTSGWMALLFFLPQLGLVFVLGVFLADQMALAWFLQTFAFVMLNKVSTSQYFMWYLALLPLVLPKSSLVSTRSKIGIGLLLFWIVSQALWLSQAYLLEHEGQPTFLQLLLCSMLFYCSQVLIVVAFILTSRLS